MGKEYRPVAEERLELIRDVKSVDMFDKDRILGALSIGDKSIVILENRKYIFEEGMYLLKYEWSPRFKRCCWEFKGIEGRTEIKFHGGKCTSHTRGCPLLYGGSVVLDGLLDIEKSYIIKVKNK